MLFVIIKRLYLLGVVMKFMLPKGSQMKSMIAVALFTLASGAFARGTMTYTVPKGEGLTEDYVVEIDRAQFRIDGDTAKLDYELPMELDGTSPTRFILKGKQENGKWYMRTLRGPVETATCVGDRDDFGCRMTIVKNDEGIFPLNIDSANEYLATRPDLTQAQITTIHNAQTLFSHEPIGIVRFKKR